MIKGLQKTSMVDYPGKVVATLFTDKCNFRCPFCHNVDLVLNSGKMPEISQEEILNFLRERKKWLDGVCITGGEPTLHKGIVDFIKKIKEIGLLVKLDTNGTNPEMLKELIDSKLVDYVAMDIKSSKENYGKATNSTIDLNKIRQSIGLLNQGKVEFEFRTTAVPKFYNKEEAKKIGEWLKGSRKYVLQQFSEKKDMLDNSLKNIKPYTKTEFEEFKEILKDYFDVVEVRI